MGPRPKEVMPFSLLQEKQHLEPFNPTHAIHQLTYSLITHDNK